MSGYDDFDALVGKLKRAAIDAYVCHGQYWQIRGDEYEISSRSSKATITRPSESGVGGGDWSGDFGWLFGTDERKDAEYREAFATICDSIDSMLDPWRELPDPMDFEPSLENSRVVTSRLASEGWSDGQLQRPAGVELHGALNSLDSEVEGIRGVTGTLFRRNFLEAIPLVVDGLLGMSLLRGGAVVAQQKLWEAAREDVAGIVKSATSGFQDSAEGAGGDLNYAFSVTGWALKGIKLFAPGIAGKAIDLASLGVEVAKGSAPTNASSEFGSYDDGIAALKAGLEDLSKGIAAEEDSVAALISGHFEVYRMKSYRNSYDLDSVQLSQGSELSLDPDRVETISNSLLPAVAVELNTIADMNASCARRGIVARGAGIGRGESGPMDEVIRLGTLLHDLLEDLAAETLEGAVQLKLALNDFAATEAEMIAEINRISAALLVPNADGIGQDLHGDITNITEDRNANPLDEEIVVHGEPQVPFLPGYGPDGKNSLVDIMKWPIIDTDGG